MKAFILTYCTCFLFLPFLYGQKLIIEDVSIINFKADAPIEHSDVYLVDGVIEEIIKHRKRKKKEEDYTLINGSGKYLIPSYADAHVHLPDSAYLRDFFLLNLLNGVTTLRSMRGEDWHLQIDQADSLCPRLFLGSVPIDETTSEDAALTIVEEAAKKGFDFVKILGVRDSVIFDKVVVAAKSEGILLGGHAPPQLTLDYICQTGIYQSVEHLGGLELLRDEVLFNMAVRQSRLSNVYHCPTLDNYYAYVMLPEEMHKKEGISLVPRAWINDWEGSIKQEQIDFTKEQLDQRRTQIGEYLVMRLELLKKLYDQGGKLLVSPDATGIYGIPGFDYHLEMQRYSEIGISNHDILKMASYNLSEMFGENKEWGDLKVGMKSDLLLLNANPLKDIRNAQDIKGIFLKGKYLEASFIKTLLN